jgi:hypothetical protein
MADFRQPCSYSCSFFDIGNWLSFILQQLRHTRVRVLVSGREHGFLGYSAKSASINPNPCLLSGWFIANSQGRPKKKGGRAKMQKRKSKKSTLTTPKLTIQPAPIHKLLVRPALSDLPAAQHDDEVAVVDGAQPVRDEDGGAVLVLQDAVYVAEEGLLRVCV